MARQISIQGKVAQRFLKYVDDNRDRLTKDAFAWRCIKAGIKEIKSKEISEKLTPIMNSTFKDEKVSISYQEDESPDVLYESMPATCQLKNKKRMLIEGCLRFMLSNRLIVIKKEKLVILD